MYYEEGALYHIYNRSNEKLFYNRENYIYFIRKLRTHLLPFSDILAYCLMPNHYHIMLAVKPEGAKFHSNEKKKDMQLLAEAIGRIQGSYTQALNNQIGRKGGLFAHNSKAKILNDANKDYGIMCFMYIYQNPLLSGLVDKIEDWEFSSFSDYIGKRDGTLINKRLAIEILNLDANDIYSLTYQLLKDKTDDDFL